MNTYDYKLFTFGSIYYTLLFTISCQFPFFWDSILLSSIYPDWYYQSNFTTLFVPEKIAGYPPYWGMYIALFWKLFTKSLFVSHISMLPLIIGIVYQTIRITKYYFKTNYLLPLIILLSEPTLITQTTQLGPDIALVFFFLLCINSILHHKTLMLSISCLFLSIVTPRGMIISVSIPILYLTHQLFILSEKKYTSIVLRILKIFTPAILVNLAWLYLHNSHFGWTLYRENYVFAEKQSIYGMLYNTGIILWRCIDQGRIILFMLLFFVVIYHKKIQLLKNYLFELALCIIPLLILSFVFIKFNNPIASRYLIIPFYFCTFIVLYIISQEVVHAHIKRYYALILLFFIGGQFLIYPEPVSNNWDASLSHIPYYGLKEQAITFIQTNNLPREEIGTGFPAGYSSSVTDLTSDTTTLSEYHFDSNTYILYSNVMNEFSKEEIQGLETKWTKIYSSQAGFVKMNIYKR